MMVTRYPLFNRLGMGIPSSIHYESFANNVVESQGHLLIYVALKIFA